MSSDEDYNEIEDSQTFYFYQSFLDLSNNIQEYPRQLDDSSFRKFMIEKAGRTVETVKTLALGLKSKIIKPQQLLYDDPEYYIAIDLLTNTYYVCYKSLLMIDIDFYKDENYDESTPVTEKVKPILQNLQQYCDKHPNLKFSVYLTQNGVHAFLLSKRMDYKSDEAIQLMIDLGCDFFYIVYSYLRGFSVRLNKKKREAHLTSPLYTHLTDIGDGSIDEYLQKLVNLHINLIEVFKNVNPCLMYGGPTIPRQIE